MTTLDLFLGLVFLNNDSGTKQLPDERPRSLLLPPAIPAWFPVLTASYFFLTLQDFRHPLEVLHVILHVRRKCSRRSALFLSSTKNIIHAGSL